ncbi:MAG: S1/P1 nuclease [Candidatus Solibacter sp.]
MRRFVVTVMLCSSLPAYGWGPGGHSLVARLAAAQLTPAATARVAEILGPGTTMASISSWADQYRRDHPETGHWHYIDIPIDKPHRDMARDCAKGDCIIAKIADFRKQVVDPAATPEARKEALMYLVHFLGDMHQPLHCSDNNDKGGNEVKLNFFGRDSNLHSIWDSGLLGRLPPEDALFAQFSQDLTPKKIRKWRQGSIEDWAEESHKVAQKVVYGKLPKAPTSGQLTIGTDYEHVAHSVIQERLEKAGTRLAALLNSMLQ